MMNVRVYTLRCTSEENALLLLLLVGVAFVGCMSGERASAVISGSRAKL